MPAPQWSAHEVDAAGASEPIVSTRANAARASLTIELARPELCGVGGGVAECTLADALILRRALLQPPTATIGQVCAPATP